MSAFTLPLTDIDTDGKHFRFSIEPSWLADALEGTGLSVGANPSPGTLDVHAQKSGDDILVMSHIVTRIVTPCARCLDDVPIDVDVNVTSLLAPDWKRPTKNDGVDDVDADAPDTEFYSGDRVVLDPIVREHIMLEDPIQPLCRPDCPGIPIPEHVKPPADFDRRDEGAVDPRLAPLMKWKRKLANNEE